LAEILFCIQLLFAAFWFELYLGHFVDGGTVYIGGEFLCTGSLYIS